MKERLPRALTIKVKFGRQPDHVGDRTIVRLPGPQLVTSRLVDLRSSGGPVVPAGPGALSRSPAAAEGCRSALIHPRGDRSARTRPRPVEGANPAVERPPGHWVVELPVDEQPPLLRARRNGSPASSPQITNICSSRQEHTCPVPELELRILILVSGADPRAECDAETLVDHRCQA
jgi:hypothetical protein